ncbi:MAG: hypothetical protein HKN13_14220 [Rhodothermales bacterium]|nr:hypothetical protein [Rhodothermales bacterium]
MIRTIEQAYEFIKEVKVCTIFATKKGEYPSLWENVNLPEKQPGEKGWGQKMEAVWTWKTRLPAEYPDDIYYGKIKGSLAVLMEMDYMAGTHFPQAYKSVRRLSQLAQHIFERISMEPADTTTLRKAIIEDFGCSKSQFDTALKHLQTTMNVVRLNDPRFERDTWVLFRELYFDVWEQYVDDNDW